MTIVLNDKLLQTNTNFYEENIDKMMYHLQN